MKLNYTGLCASLLVSFTVSASPLSEDESDLELNSGTFTAAAGKENRDPKSNIGIPPTPKGDQSSKPEKDTNDEGREVKSQQGAGSALGKGKEKAGEEEQVQVQVQVQVHSNLLTEKNLKEARQRAAELTNVLYSLDQGTMHMWSLYQQSVQESLLIADLEAKLDHVLKYNKGFISDQSTPYVTYLCKELSALKGANKAEQELNKIAERVQDNPYLGDMVALRMAHLHKESLSITAQAVAIKKQLDYVLEQIAANPKAADQAAPYINALQTKLSALKTPTKAEQELKRVSAIMLQDDMHYEEAQEPPRKSPRKSLQQSSHSGEKALRKSSGSVVNTERSVSYVNAHQEAQQASSSSPSQSLMELSHSGEKNLRKSADAVKNNADIEAEAEDTEEAVSYVNDHQKAQQASLSVNAHNDSPQTLQVRKNPLSKSAGDMRNMVDARRRPSISMLPLSNTATRHSNDAPAFFHSLPKARSSSALPLATQGSQDGRNALRRSGGFMRSLPRITLRRNNDAPAPFPGTLSKARSSSALPSATQGPTDNVSNNARNQELRSRRLSLSLSTVQGLQSSRTSPRDQLLAIVSLGNSDEQTTEHQQLLLSSPRNSPRSPRAAQ